MRKNEWIVLVLTMIVVMGVGAYMGGSLELGNDVSTGEAFAASTSPDNTKASRLSVERVVAGTIDDGPEGSNCGDEASLCRDTVRLEENLCYDMVSAWLATCYVAADGDTDKRSRCDNTAFRAYDDCDSLSKTKYAACTQKFYDCHDQ